MSSASTPNEGPILPWRLLPGLAVLAVAFMAAFACGEGDTTSVDTRTGEAGDPALSLSASSLSLTAVEGDSATGSVSISNSGDGVLDSLEASTSYAAAQPDGWLSVAVDGFRAPAELTASATAAGLVAGTYDATVTVSSSAGTADVGVTFVVEPEPQTDTYALDVAVDPTAPIPGGSVARSPDQAGYDPGTSVTVTARAADGYRFVGWTGDVYATTRAVEVTMDGDRSLTAHFTLEAPALGTPAVRGDTITLDWTYTWPCGSPCLASTSDAYVVEESTDGSDGPYDVIYTASSRPSSPFQLSFTRSPGTYYYRVRAYVDELATYTPYSGVRGVAVDPSGTVSSTVRIINDLPGDVMGPNDWGLLNTIIRVRAGPTLESVITNTAPAEELLFPYDYTTFVEDLIAIQPGEEMTLDVSGYTTEYFLYIQTGWWDYYDDMWNKHMAIVAGCDGSSAHKWTTIRVYPPFGSPEVIRASDFLPPGNWYGSTFCD